MNIYVRIEFVIDDTMAWHAIEHLLNSGERVSRRRVISLCRNHLAQEGAMFETEPQFDDTTEFRQVDVELVDKWFERIWK